MSSIKAPLEEIKQRLRDSVDGLHVVTYNNQFEYMEQGAEQAYPLPAVFVEIVAPQERMQIGNGLIEGEVVFRAHVAHVEYDAQDGTMNENKAVYDLKDSVVKALHLYKPVACSNLFLVAESQDYEHTNLYHYILDFKCSFIDDTGDVRKDLIEKPGDTTTLNVTVVSVNVLTQ